MPMNIRPEQVSLEDERLDLTEQSKVFCTLLGNPGAGRWIQYVSIDLLRTPSRSI
jgi:hypothetical protein